MATMAKTTPKRLVWRIAPATPMGLWVDPTLPAPRSPVVHAGEPLPGNWLGSSFDLLHGVDVDDDPDTQPDTLWDEFFGQRVEVSDGSP